MTSELADRVERADGPSRELDVEIALAIGWRLDQSGPNDLWREPGRADWVELPEFTASLDAALTLVPEGWKFHLTTEHTAVAKAAAHADVMDRDWPDPQAGYGIVTEAHAATPALALAAAALRARAREGE